jgi:cell division protein FtsQ
MSDRESWAVKLSNGITVVLGKDSPEGALRERVEKFKKVYSTLEPAVPGGLEEIDMRYANGLTIRPTVKTSAKSKPIKPSSPVSEEGLAD